MQSREDQLWLQTTPHVSPGDFTDSHSSAATQQSNGQQHMLTCCEAGPQWPLSVDFASRQLGARPGKLSPPAHQSRRGRAAGQHHPREAVAALHAGVHVGQQRHVAQWGGVTAGHLAGRRRGAPACQELGLLPGRGGLPLFIRAHDLKVKGAVSGTAPGSREDACTTPAYDGPPPGAAAACA